MLLAAAKALSSQASATCAFSVASGAPAGAAKAVLGHSKGALASSVAPVAAGGSGGRGRHGRNLGYGALAAFAGAGLYLAACASDDEEDFEEDPQADFEQDSQEDFPGSMNSTGRRPPSAREVRALKRMLKQMNNQLKNRLKSRKENEPTDSFWGSFEDLVKKAQLVQSAITLWTNFSTETVRLIENIGDANQYYVCPFSGFNELVYVITIERKSGNSTGGNAVIKISCTERLGNLTRLQVMGRITSTQFEMQGLPLIGIALEEAFHDLECIPKKATLIKVEGDGMKWDNDFDMDFIPKKATLIKAEGNGTRNRCDNSLGPKNLILNNSSALITYLGRFKVMLGNIKGEEAIKSEIEASE